MIAYHINGTTADRAEMNITQYHADELAAQGWLISADPIVWAENQYIDGEIVPIPAPPEPEPYVPTPEEVAEQTKQQLIWSVQNHLDTAARQLGYDDIKTAVTYADEPAVPKFQTEGKAFRAWRSLVWAACYATLADVLDNKRDVPTVDELLAELPVLEVQGG